jgi:hypothetical protein
LLSFCRLLACALLLAGALSAPAAAVSLTYTISGSITFIDADLAAETPPFAVGDQFEFVFAIDSAAMGSVLAPGAVQYFPVTGLSVTLNSAYSLSASAPDMQLSGSVFVQDGTTDQFQQNIQVIPGTAPDLGSYRLMQVVTTFHDTAGTMFSSTGLPTTLDAADFNSINSVDMIFRNPGDLADQRSVFGTATLAMVTVPEPTTALLVGTALLLGCARHGRRG